MESSNLPGEFQQLKNFREARRAVKKSEIGSFLFTPVVTGFSTIIPNEVRESHIFEEKDKAQVAKDFLALQVAMNDRIDFSMSGREDIDPLIDESREKEDIARVTLDRSLTSISDPAQREWMRYVIQESVSEVEFVERYARSKNLSSEGALQYRRLINAISMTAVSAVIFGEGQLGDKLKMVEDYGGNWDKLVSKYSWVINGDNSNNNVQTAVAVVEKVLTAGQIVDDWYGRKIDKELNIPSIALTTVKEESDEEMARRALWEKRQQFLESARSMGLGQLPTKTFDIAFKTVLSFSEKGSEIARKNYKLFMKYGMGKRILKKTGARERAYIEGKFKST